MNKTILLGTITRDIELKYAPSGSAIANISVAWNEKYKKQDGSYEDKAHFFDVKAFGKRAETINQYFRKGSRILIEGVLNHETWSAADGSNRQRHVIKCENFTFVDRKEQQQPQYQQPQQHEYQVPQNINPQQMPQINIDDEEIPF